MSDTFQNIPPTSGGGGGAVDSVNGQTGVVVLTKSDIGLGNVNNTSDLNKPISTATQTALDGKQDDILGSNSRLIVKDSGGAVESLETHTLNGDGGISVNLDSDISTLVSVTTSSNSYNVNATENAPNNNFQLDYTQINIDTNDSGFQIGTNGNAINVHNLNVIHEGESDIGSIQLITNSFTMGNGTDAIDVKGFGYQFGFGEFKNNVTINGPVQGYGFQPTVRAGATVDQSTSYTQAFYDTMQYEGDSSYHTSFFSSPTIDNLPTGRNYQGLNSNPNIDTIAANAGISCLAVGGTMGTFGSGAYYHGLSVNPNITSARYAAGVDVTMDNVTVFAGVAASLVIQDLTIAADQPGSVGNTVTIEYAGGGTAGAEVVSDLGLAFSVQIEDGVSTAQNIADALNAYVNFTTNLNVTISGTASDPQNIQAATNLANGEDPGTKYAARLDGNVEITGTLAFSGALSIGQLQAFYASNPVDGGGSPQNMHGLTTQMTALNGVTTANCDAIGVNTAMLITLEDNSINTSGAFGLGFTALALPCVVETHTGSSLDFMSAATYAINLSGASTGGTIDNLKLCRSIAIPNGITTITRMSGFQFDLPFGDPGTTSWGFYETPGVHNYFQGDLLIGGTAGSDDVVTNSSIALEIKSTTKAFMNARMTTTQRDALTAVNGMQIYNSTTDKLQVYAGGSWVDLH